MPARASAANQAALRDRPPTAEPSRSAAIGPRPGSWPDLSLRLRESSPSSCPAHQLVPSNAAPRIWLRTLSSDKYLIPTELTGYAYRAGRDGCEGASPLVSRGLPDRAAEGAPVAVRGGQSSTSSRAGPDSKPASRAEGTGTIG